MEKNKTEMVNHPNHYGGESNPAQSYNPAPTAAADSNEAMDDLPF